ncbi:MAG: hypothetical protein GF317_04770 [Candidatus Lokiarchaeota archaeon]|nr:hypothetical protein [Candidatus Lokiarchaeota archaeon]
MEAIGGENFINIMHSLYCIFNEWKEINKLYSYDLEIRKSNYGLVIFCVSNGVIFLKDSSNMDLLSSLEFFRDFIKKLDAMAVYLERKKIRTRNIKLKKYVK